MALQRIIWEEKKERFVDFQDRGKEVHPTPLGFPTSFFVCNPEREGITDEQAIEEHKPKRANAYCSGNIRSPGIHDVPQRCSYEVQYYKI